MFNWRSKTKVWCAASLLSCIALAACGSGGSHKATGNGDPSGKAPSTAATSAPQPAGRLSPGGSFAPGTTVADVEGHAITLGEVRHWIATSGTIKQEVPQPPEYTRCVARLRASGQGSAAAPPGELQATCRHQYEAMLESGLQSTIHTRWLLGEAREQGLKIDQATLRQEVRQGLKAGNESHQTLASTGQSLSDLKFKLKLNQISNQLYEAVERRIPKVNTAQIARYYNAHKQSFALPEERDLHIVRTTTEAGAKKALAAIRSGKSFATVVKESATRQPIYSDNGLVLGLKPKVYAEPPLNDAIFKARPGVLSGPVKISLGLYVFEVVRVIPAHQQTLAQVRASIAKLLPELLHNQTLSGFVRGFRAKWTARTDCRAGYVVENCRQYKGPKAVRDAYTI